MFTYLRTIARFTFANSNGFINRAMIVLDDFLEISQFKKLQNIILSADFPWFYIPNVSLPPGSQIEDPLAVETMGYLHTVYDFESENKSFLLEGMEPFISAYEKKFQKINKLLRIRISKKHPRIGFTKDNYNLPHVDLPIPHTTLIYYLNDSDGDTRVFDQFHINDIEPKMFTTKARITPKENRLLKLDGLNYHTASNPFDYDRRIVLNINLI